MRPLALVALALGLAPLAAHAQQWPPSEESFFDWSQPQFPEEEYDGRRARLLELLGDRGPGVVLIPSGDGVTHGQTFRQLDDFNYFTGLELPGSALVLDTRDCTATLYVPPRDFRFENPSRRNDFPGRPLGDDPAIEARAGVDAVLPHGELARALDSWQRGGVVVWINGGTGGELPTPFPGLGASMEPAATSILALRATHPELRLSNVFESVARLRMVKSAAEIDVMRRAAAATAEGIRHAAAYVEVGVDERTLEGEFELACKRAGSQRLAFSSIVKSGPNSLWPWRVLAAHYDRRNRALVPEDLVIFDVGCEVDYYSSDVGRTFPATGSFAPRQRELLEMITAVSDAVIDAVRPGVTLAELRAVAVNRIPEAERRHMQTGSFYGHHVGLAVGDPALAELPLEPGMVFTVEPWYYNHEEAIAVFVEDDVLVTPQGVEVLTRGLPRGPAELEAMVRAAREGGL